MKTLFIGVVIIIIFIWRLFYIHQLFLTSKKIIKYNLKPIKFDPRNVDNFINQIFLGQRSLKPISFFIRGFVVAIIAVLLFPFKDYEPILFRLLIFLIIIYIFWCLLYGLMLYKVVKIKNNEK